MILVTFTACNPRCYLASSFLFYLDVDVGAQSDEDGPDEEEEEVEDGDQLVEHAVAAVVHLGGFPCRVCLKFNTCNVEQSYRVALADSIFPKIA